jgi:hypothetical protein
MAFIQSEVSCLTAIENDERLFYTAEATLAFNPLESTWDI